MCCPALPTHSPNAGWLASRPRSRHPWTAAADDSPGSGRENEDRGQRRGQAAPRAAAGCLSALPQGRGREPPRGPAAAAAGSVPGSAEAALRSEVARGVDSFVLGLPLGTAPGDEEVEAAMASRLFRSELGAAEARAALGEW